MSLVHQKSIEAASEVGLLLHWLLLSIEITGITFQTTAIEREISILSRRTRAYQVMSRQLSETNGFRSDDLIVSLAIATSAEQTTGNPKAASYHCHGVKTLLMQRGGLKSLRNFKSYPEGIEVLNCLIGQGLPGLYSDQDVLPKIKNLRVKLREMQYWNERLWLTRSLQCPSIDATEGKGGIVNVGLQKRIDVFSDRPMLEYVNIPPRVLNDADYRWLLPVLYTINSTLFAFRGNHSMTLNYLELLGDSVRQSNNTNFICKCVGQTLPSLVLIIIFGHTAQKSDSTNDSSGREVYHIEEILEFVELLMMAGKETRDYILEALWSWLTAVDYGDIIRLSRARLDVLGQEIVATWNEDRQKRSH